MFLNASMVPSVRLEPMRVFHTSNGIPSVAASMHWIIGPMSKSTGAMIASRVVASRIERARLSPRSNLRSRFSSRVRRGGCRSLWPRHETRATRFGIGDARTRG